MRCLIGSLEPLHSVPAAHTLELERAQSGCRGETTSSCCFRTVSDSCHRPYSAYAVARWYLVTDIPTCALPRVLSFHTWRRLRFTNVRRVRRTLKDEMATARKWHEVGRCSVGVIQWSQTFTWAMSRRRHLSSEVRQRSLSSIYALETCTLEISNRT